jgi:hypothetical protein
MRTSSPASPAQRRPKNVRPESVFVFPHVSSAMHLMMSSSLVSLSPRPSTVWHQVAKGLVPKNLHFPPRDLFSSCPVHVVVV